MQYRISSFHPFQLVQMFHLSPSAFSQAFFSRPAKKKQQHFPGVRFSIRKQKEKQNTKTTTYKQHTTSERSPRVSKGRLVLLLLSAARFQRPELARGAARIGAMCLREVAGGSKAIGDHRSDLEVLFWVGLGSRAKSLTSSALNGNYHPTLKG